MIDTTTSGGKLVFHIFLVRWPSLNVSSFASAQTLVSQLRGHGRVGGRPSVMTADKIATVRQMYASNEYTISAIAEVVGVSRATVYRHIEDSPPSPGNEN